MTSGVVALLGWAARWLWQVRRERRARRRLAELVAGERVADVPRRRAWRAAGRWLPPAGVVCAGWVVVGGLAGLAVGLACAAGLWRLRVRQEAAGSRQWAREAARAERQLPLAADLLAACIAAGAGPVTAAQAVGETLAGPVGDALARGAAEVRLGGEPAAAWQRLAALPGARCLARRLERPGVPGLPLAAPAARHPAETRAEWARAATARARRAAVMVSAPVGLCFLPAFVAVGVVPVVIGLAGGVLGGGGR